MTSLWHGLLLAGSLLAAAGCRAPDAPSNATSQPAEPPTDLAGPAAIPGLDAQGVAVAVYDRWVAGDKDGAAPWFAAEAGSYLGTLFDHPYQAAEGWTPQRCDGAAGSYYCSWASSSATLTIRVSNLAPPPMVTEVRFESAMAP